MRMEADLPVETVLLQDIAASGKKVKQFASQVYVDKSHTNATDRMWKALNGRSPRLKGIEWLDTCRAVKQSYFSIKYFTETLEEYLSETQIMDLVVGLMQRNKKRLTDENLEVLVSHVNQIGGFASPTRADNSLPLLQAKREEIMLEMAQVIQKFQAVDQTYKLLMTNS